MQTLLKFQSIHHNIIKEDKIFIQEAKITSSKPTTNYPFVNLIRFISIMGVVWAHVLTFNGYKNEKDFLETVGHIRLYIPFMQFFKFGVICFFMISGFLLGDKIKTENLFYYYKRRLQSTVKPFLVVLLIFITFYTLRNYTKYHASSFLEVLNSCLFHTHLWYLPNFLIALSVILIFYKFLDSKIFGSSLFTITLLYSILTVYTHQYQSSNTYALFGFVFYLWLGIYIRRNNKLLKKIQQIKIRTLVVILIMALGFSCIEAYLLYQDNLDHVNLLRIFNQLYSVTMFIFLIRICNSSPNFGVFNPRKETFGIYLYHGILTYYLLPRSIAYLYEHNILDLSAHTIYTFMVYHVIYFVITYLTATAIVKVLLKYNLAYLQNKC